MALKYDYDVYWLDPHDFESGSHSVGAEPALPAEARSKYRARFRDIVTLEALRGADPEVQALFEASGFALSRSVSDLPYGFFAAKDLAARTDITERLSENLAGLDLTGKNTNDICLRDFIAYEDTAQPMESGAPRTGRLKLPSPVAMLKQLRKRLRFPTVNPLGLAFLTLLAIVLPKLFSTLLHA